MTTGERATDERTAKSSLDTGLYLERFGVDPKAVQTTDLETLTRLHRKHIRRVPFENLAITGDPQNRMSVSGVELSLESLYEKIVLERRGGYCFELNGLFCWLLWELGYDAKRVPARVLSDGDPGTPANHHSIVVTLDEQYVVDVGLGTPKLPQSLPLDGSIVSGPVADWRLVPADRPDEEYRVETREDDDWEGRYVFRENSVDLEYFRATNDYLQTAPESPFTGTPHLSIATDQGYVSCDDETLTRVRGDDTIETALSETEWYDHLESTFGIEPED
jgi:N-hydroxyarylamine O-acetyltransferase